MIGIAGVWLAVLVSAAPAGAADLLVDSAADSAPDPMPNNGCEATGGDECTLREAIATSNDSTTVNDDIPINVTGTINLESSLPSISDGVTITGPGPGNLTVQPGVIPDFRIFNLFGATAADSITIRGLTIKDGRPLGVTALNGGGVFAGGAGDNTLENVVVTGSSATGSGGGAHVDLNSSLRVIRGTISGNTAAADGGGISNQGELVIESSTIAGNVITGTTGRGGGIWSGETSGDLAVVTNSTIANNSATSTGGGINLSNGILSILSSTIAGNTADSDNTGSTDADGGGIMVISTDSNAIANTILAENQIGTTSPIADDCGLGIGAVLVSGGYNLRSTEDPVACDAKFVGTGDFINAMPLLGTLASYGGPTPTIPLLTGSPALNAGNPSTPANAAYPACPANDQRGAPRGGAEGQCDIGAFEGIFVPPPPTSPAPPAGAPTGAGRKRCKKGRKLVRRKGKLRCKKKKKKRN